MPGAVIDKYLNNGFAGNFAMTPDSIIVSRANADSAPLYFGSACQSTSDGKVTSIKATFTPDDFAGVVASAVKTNTSYPSLVNGGSYAPDEMVAVFQRGKISVKCGYGSPSPNGEVYIRTVTNANGKIGAFDATSEALCNVLIPQLRWQNVADTNSVATLVLLSQINA